MLSLEELGSNLYSQLKDKDPFKNYSLDQQGDIIVKFIEMTEILRQPLIEGEIK